MKRPKVQTKNQGKLNNSISLAINITSALQLCMFFWAVWIIVQNNSKTLLTVSDALGPIVPIFLFIVLGLVNMVLLAVLIFQCFRQKIWPNYLTTILLLAILLITFIGEPVLSAIDKH